MAVRPACRREHKLSLVGVVRTEDITSQDGCRKKLGQMMIAPMLFSVNLQCQLWCSRFCLFTAVPLICTQLPRCLVGLFLKGKNAWCIELYSVLVPTWLVTLALFPPTILNLPDNYLAGVSWPWFETCHLAWSKFRQTRSSAAWPGRHWLLRPWADETFDRWEEVFWKVVEPLSGAKSYSNYRILQDLVRPKDSRPDKKRWWRLYAGRS